MFSNANCKFNLILWKFNFSISSCTIGLCILHPTTTLSKRSIWQVWQPSWMVTSAGTSPRLLAHVLNVAAINGSVNVLCCKMIFEAIYTMLAIWYMNGYKHNGKARIFGVGRDAKVEGADWSWHQGKKNWHNFFLTVNYSWYQSYKEKLYCFGSLVSLMNWLLLREMV